MFILDQHEMEKLFTKVGELIPYKTSITVCGGASIVLAHKFRDSTVDIDCIECDQTTINLMQKVSQKIGTDCLLNDDVKVTTSYTRELMQFRKLYKVYGNLTVYLISGVTLLCMKLRSFRPDSHDYEDCINLATLCMNEGLTYADVQERYTQIYTSDASMSIDAEVFIHDRMGVNRFTLDKESIESYKQMIADKLISLEDLPEEIRTQITF